METVQWRSGVETNTEERSKSERYTGCSDEIYDRQYVLQMSNIWSMTYRRPAFVTVALPQVYRGLRKL